MKKIMIVIQAGLLLAGLAACDKKESYEPTGKDAVAQISVVDEKGNPQAGAAVLVFDEKGYEQFQKDRKTEPQGFTLTLRGGKVSYRLPYKQWFQNGSRQVTFVVMEELDEQNYHIWTVGRTVKAGQEVKIEFTLDRTSTGPGNSGEKSDVSETGEKEVSKDTGNPAVTVGSPFEMYDQENGHTLFANALFLDSDHRFDGDNRYTMADAGAVESLSALEGLSLDRASHRISAWPGHGYFLCKDILLTEFPSGKRAMAVGAEYVRIHVSEWIVRDGKNVGVKFDYAIDKLSGEGLPEPGTVYDVKLAGERSISIPLPARNGDAECTPWGQTPLRISYAEDHAIVQITDPKAAVGKEYRLLIRAGARYVETKLRVVE